MFKLSYEYDTDGFHEEKQRDLRKRIQAIKARDQSNADEELIIRDPNGQIVMHRSNFDFIEKPLAGVSPKRAGKGSQIRDNLAKSFQVIARQKHHYS